MAMGYKVLHLSQTSFAISFSRRTTQRHLLLYHLPTQAQPLDLFLPLTNPTSPINISCPGPAVPIGF